MIAGLVKEERREIILGPHSQSLVSERQGGCFSDFGNKSLLAELDETSRCYTTFLYCSFGISRIRGSIDTSYTTSSSVGL